MTIAVAVKKNYTITLATDSLFSLNGCSLVSADNFKGSKIIKSNDAMISIAGMDMFYDITLKYLCECPEEDVCLETEEDIYGFFLGLYRFAFEHCFLDRFADDDEANASFLIANEHGIFYVASDLSVSKFDQYWAIGSGAEYALGSLANNYGRGATGQSLAQMAVQTAISFDLHCGGEIITEVLVKEK